MKIRTIMKRRQTLSFEVFPPKPGIDDDMSGIASTLSALRAASPDFVSVTYGAGGSDASRAADIAHLVTSLGMSPLSHLTAVGATKKKTQEITDMLASLGVENILALRGDVPEGADPSDPTLWSDMKTSIDLAASLDKSKFCIGGAAYPEGHRDSVSPEADIDFMRRKVDAGVSFFITQLCFDDDVLFRFVDRARSTGVDAPIIVGVMPVLVASQIKRIIEISGCSVPRSLDELITKHADDSDGMREAGIEYAVAQVRRLWDAGLGVHIYTMNKSKSVLEIVRRTGFID